MEKFVKRVVDEMNKSKLFASQGGPIILFQVDNKFYFVFSLFKWLYHFCLLLGSVFNFYQFDVDRLKMSITMWRPHLKKRVPNTFIGQQIWLLI
jgi:Glycosyl hydrolases family 35